MLSVEQVASLYAVNQPDDKWSGASSKYGGEGRDARPTSQEGSFFCDIHVIVVFKAN